MTCKNKAKLKTMAISNSLLLLTYKNTYGFSIWFVFAKLAATTLNEIMQKTVVCHMEKESTAQIAHLVLPIHEQTLKKPKRVIFYHRSYNDK